MAVRADGQRDGSWLPIESIEKGTPHDRAEDRMDGLKIEKRDSRGSSTTKFTELVSGGVPVGISGAR